MRRGLLMCVAVGVAAPLAHASSITVSAIGGGVDLQSGPLSAFSASVTSWSDASLAGIHSTLNAAGIDTEGRVTILAADTEQGLALLTLVDRVAAGGAETFSSLQLDSVADDLNTAFVNSDSPLTIINAGVGLATGALAWDSSGGGAAFAWANLQNGNTMTFRFEKIAGSPGLISPATFQFVTWTGGAWSVVPLPQSVTSFSESDEYGFSAVVVPAPGAVALLGAGVLCLVSRRRR